jgi:hypothetical protein
MILFFLSLINFQCSTSFFGKFTFQTLRDERHFVKLRDEHRLRVFESRVLRRIFGLMREEVAGGLRWLYNQEYCNLFSSPYLLRVVKSRRMR